MFSKCSLSEVMVLTRVNSTALAERIRPLAARGRAGAAAALGRVLAVAAVAVALGVASAPAALAGEYLLGPQDHVRLKIYEWRPSRDQIFEWTALNDAFTVGAGGQLSLPFAGEVRAEGVTPGELAANIAEQLKQQMGLGHAPDVAVEVVQFRPFYIVGHVMAPGEFPYRPGLTVLQAVSIAGGLRTREDSISRMEREVISGRGEVSVLELSQISLLARRSRLEAELEGAEEIVFPPALTERQDDRAVAVLMEKERSIFATQKEGMRTQLQALRELREFLEQELTSLETHVSLLDGQLELVRDELSGVETLVDQGLAVATRQMALERSLLQGQSERLSAETALLRARQELSRTDLSILELRNRHLNEVSTQLRETETLLNETGRRADTALQLLHESEVTAPRLLALRAEAARSEPQYTIVRPAEAGPAEIAATEATAVLPGDTIKVEVPLPAGFEALGLLSDAPEVAAPPSPVQAAGGAFPTRPRATITE
jgi:protein involved in polysaccharide export with SLBB domain